MSDNHDEKQDRNNVTPLRPPEDAPVNVPIRTMFSVAYDEQGGATFSFGGTRPNLMELMGLLEHARKNVEKLWEQTYGPKPSGIIRP